MPNARHDWPALVRNNLPQRALSALGYREIVAELASHLEEFYETQRVHGIPERDAFVSALEQIENWRKLARKIETAKRKDTQMNRRTKSFWLPAFLNLFAASLFLALIAQTSYQIRMVNAYPRLVIVVYPIWLAIQPVLGAIGAYTSRRGGGTRLARLAAGLFPALVFATAIVAVVLIRALVVGFRGGDGHVFGGHLDVWDASLSMIVIPGAALLLGTLPFLRSQTPSLLAQD